MAFHHTILHLTIRKVHNDTSMNVNTMSIKDWTQILTEENLTMDITDTRAFKPCRAEILSPNTDWALSWKISCLKGFGSDLTSFNFKLLHRLLVTKERLHHLTPAGSPLCSFCSNINEDLEHALITCDYNHDVGNKLLSTVQNYIPQISGQALLRLELAGLPEEVEFCLTYFISSILMTICDLGKENVKVQNIPVRPL